MPKPENIFLRGRVYYAKIILDRKVERISLKTSDRKLAKQKAAAIRRELEYGNFAVLAQLRGAPESSTIGELFAAFAAFWGARKRPVRTCKDYQSALLRILAASYPKHGDEALKKLKLASLTADLLERYQEKKIDDAADHADLQRKLEALRSDVRQARAIVSPRTLRSSHFSGLKLPDLADFRALELEEPEKQGYRAPSLELIRRTIAEAETLRQQDRPRWYAFMLACGVGLRRSEGIAARWEWLVTVPVVTPLVDGSQITRADHQLRVDITRDFRTKRSQRVVSIDATIAAALEQNRDQALPHIIPLATPTARATCFAENARWLRSLGWDPRRPNHHLRKFYADTLRQLYGLEAAQRAMGHKNQRTTEEIYSGVGGVGQTASFMAYAAGEEAAK